jgi:hypothetical protein
MDSINQRNEEYYLYYWKRGMIISSFQSFPHHRYIFGGKLPQMNKKRSNIRIFEH